MNTTRLKKIIPKSCKQFYHYLSAFAGAVYFGFPSKKLLVIGITGTSGKSSTVQFLRELLESQGHVVGSLSTVDFYINGKTELNDKKMTMLGHAKTQYYLRRMLDEGCSIAIVESTSQGAVQHRHKWIHFDYFCLTNLYPEHIEAHGSFKKYKDAKKSLFTYFSELPPKEIRGIRKEKFVIVNKDIIECDEFIQASGSEAITFGHSGNAVLHLDNEMQSSKGLTFSINNIKFHAREVLGIQNAKNITCAIAICKAIGISIETLVLPVSKLKGVPGRLEFIEECKNYGFDILVDYAFEPIAMTALYETVSTLGYKRIIHVFGATGGGRDKGRRAPLGNIAANNATFSIITNEDPYDDDPMEIMKDVEKGFIHAEKMLHDDYIIEPDRKKAILKAVSMAKKGDVILITGKGSELGMCVAGGQIVPWDDRDISRKAIKKVYGKNT